MQGTRYQLDDQRLYCSFTRCLQEPDYSAELNIITDASDSTITRHELSSYSFYVFSIRTRTHGLRYKPNYSGQTQEVAAVDLELA